MGRRGKAGELERCLSGGRAAKAHPAPKVLQKTGRALWKNIVTAYPDDYFRAGDWPLLQSYCQEFERHEEAQKHLLEEGAVIPTASGGMRRSPWHDVLVASINAMTAIATKLRLCANSRVDRKVRGLGDANIVKEKGRSGLMFGDFPDKTDRASVQ